MAWPTKTLASLANASRWDLPTRYFNDSSDSNPFSIIVDENGRALAFGINLSALVGATGLLAAEVEVGEISTAELADLAVTEPKIAAGALPASSLGRAKIATGFFDAATVLDLFAAGALTTANLDALIADDQLTEALLSNLILTGAFTTALLDVIIADDQFTESLVDNVFAAGAIDGTDRIKSASIGDDRMVSSLVKESGRIAVGLVDFNATGDCTSVDVGPTAVYTRHDTTPDLPNGVWEDGASGTESATKLAQAINGDTRNAGGPYYAAVAAGTTCWIMSLVVGTVGNVSIIKTGGTDPDVQENLVGGADAAVKQALHIMHTVTTEEGTQVEVVIPLPFDAVYFSWQVFDSTGGIYPTEITDRATVTAASSPVPAYFKLLTQGATHIQAGDIIRLTVVN